MHKRKLAHLDVKSPNILLTRDNRAKLADMGLAKMMKGSFVATLTTGGIGTWDWTAPEVLMGNYEVCVRDWLWSLLPSTGV